MSPTARKIAAALLLLLGAQVWLVVGRGQWGYLPGPVVWAVVLLLAVVPPVNRRLAKVLDRVAKPTPRTRLLVALLVAIVAGAYLYASAVGQGREFILKITDENSYAVQARMLAAGRLWQAAHPAAESFDSPYVLVRPVYASMYFPGTALTLVPAVWLGLPWWVTPLVASAVATGALYRVVTELADGVAGLLAALMLVSLPIFRELSLRLYSQAPMLLLALLLIWAWLAWRKNARPWRALLIGLLAGWMLIVRPLDALVFLTPIAVAMTLDLPRSELRRRAAVTLAVVVAGALPFLALQLAANRGITGSWLTTPHAFYAARDFPGITLGFHEPRPSGALVTKTPQKIALYEEFLADLKRHRPDTFLSNLGGERVRRTIEATLPSNLLVVLLPLGAMVAFTSARARGDSGGGRAWVLAAPLPLFVLAYAFYLFYMWHYLIVVAPAMIFLIVLAARELPQLWPRVRNALTVFTTLSLIVVPVWELPQIHRSVRDDVGAGDLVAIDEMLANLPHRPALVLFRWQPGVSPHREPVYNTRTLRIEDADVIRAHDLPGEANRRLLEYFASRQPQRHVYRVTRAPEDGAPKLEYLGRVGEVSRTAEEPL